MWKQVQRGAVAFGRGYSLLVPVGERTARITESKANKFTLKVPAASAVVVKIGAQ
jgi:hypothetical protein